VTGRLRIATFNAGLHPEWFPYVDERAALLTDALTGLEADVVALQEVWTEPLQRLVGSAYPHSVSADPLPPAAGAWAAGGATGVMLLSREPFDDVAVVELDGLLLRRAVLTVRIGSVTIMATHLTAYLRNAEHPDPLGWPGENQAQGRRVIELAAGVPGPLVLAGDLNCGPPGPGLIGEMEESYRTIRSAFELNPYLEGPAPQCTWCPGNPMVTVGDHGVIDHVMARGLRSAGSRRIFDRPVVLPDGTATPLSDHYGVLVEFEI